MSSVDTHAHLSRAYFGPDEIAAVLGRARAAGVAAVIDVGTGLADSREAIERAAGDPFLRAAAGFHPHEAKDLDDAAFAALSRLAADDRVVAVGECGLDYHYDHSPREAQRAALRRQIGLARAVKKPLVLHNRESDADLLVILAEEGAREAGGVVHAFSSGVATAAKLLDLGFHLGFGGMITFKNADDVRRALAATPLDRILLETDSPYLTPVPHRGQRNEPARVALVAERAAVELKRPAGEVAAATTANAARLFGLRFPPGSDSR
jgi:TatD DNase family protein